jgi:flagellin-like hook-associated protein FlgL
MSGDVALTSALRNNLLSLQNTQRSIDTTQFRLATGRKVNSALDNPLNFFRAQSFNNRAGDLSRLLDGIALSIRTIEEADKGVTALTNLLETADSIIDEAKTAYNSVSDTVAVISIATAGGNATTGDTLSELTRGLENFNATDSITIEIDGAGTVTVNGASTVAQLVTALSTGDLAATYSATTGLITVTVANQEDFDDITITITDTGTEASFQFGSQTLREGDATVYEGLLTIRNDLADRYNAVLNEINGIVADASFQGINLLDGDNLVTTFNEDGSSQLSTDGSTFTAVGLGLSFTSFDSFATVTSSEIEINNAVEDVRSFGSTIATDLAIIQNRRDFTEATINTLEAGADDLTLADLNEEGANLLALQTRQQLGVTSLSLASQSQQSVLRLF